MSRVTIPTDLDVINETLEIMELWGADALRDCDGTEFPESLKSSGAKIYNTYYTTRKDNEWAKANPDEIQQMYVMSGFYTADSDILTIPLLKGISPDLLSVNTTHDIKRWWEVIDRTTGHVVNTKDWEYADESVIIKNTKMYHEYTVSFLTFIIWDPVHMYNAVVNDWQDFERQMTFDIRQPKTKEYSKKRLIKFLTENPHVDVVRFTTFFHQFTLIFDELRRQKYVDWYGYSASVSPHILEQFEKESGYKFRAEFIIDQGYYNNQYRIPSKEYNDFMAFQRREVALLAKELVDICHEHGKEAMMFLGDHFIGTDPWMDEFATIGLDAVVGSVGNGATLRLISDIKGVKYTEGRFLPYFFPDTFHEKGDPVKEAKENWITARRAILRKPIDRIGYGGYLKLALQFPDFIQYVKNVCDEFRDLYGNIVGKPYSVAKVAVLNAWGKKRAWGNHMVHHALYQKENYSYFGVMEVLAGGPYDVGFISFDDIINNQNVLEEYDVIINVGTADTAHTGGYYWANEEIMSAVRGFVAKGGGFIGIGEPTGHQREGRFIQLANVLGIEKETGFTLGYSKFNTEIKEHFITEDLAEENIFGEGTLNMYALEGADVLYSVNGSVQMAANSFMSGRSVYFGGMEYSPKAAAILKRAIFWVTGKENHINTWHSENPYVEVNYYPDSQKVCIVNNTDKPQKAKVWLSNKLEEFDLKSCEIVWRSIL